MSLLFSDKAEDCGAVREAFILSLSHCGGGWEGDVFFYLAVVGQTLRQAQVVVCCIYVTVV